jgi:broad specificity phosphatase PhoE
MEPGTNDLDQLERDAYRIVGRICSESVSEGMLEQDIERLRAKTLQAFPANPSLFDRTYGRRFRRLRTRFHAGGGLIA